MPEIDIVALQKLSAERLPTSVREIIEAAPMPGLVDGPQCASTESAIEDLVGGAVKPNSLLESALWLLAGKLDRSHGISQGHHSAEGSFWHGIMHRREPDYWNSKYWFNKVGVHPVHEKLATHIEECGDKSIDLPWRKLEDSSLLAEALVDAVEKSQRKEPDWIPELERICWWEWQLLLAHCLG